MPGSALATRVGPDRRTAASMAVGALVACAVLASADPDEHAVAVCPTRALLGLDCPACGALRGLHALSRGRLGEALDHNLLLLGVVPLGLLLWLTWAAAALGRPAPALRAPRWLAPTAIAVALVFTVLRNLPGDGLSWFASGA